MFSDVWHIYLPYLYSFISFIGVLLLLCKYHISFIGVLLLLYKYHIPFIGVLLLLSVTFLSSVFYSVSHCFHQYFTFALCHISFISVLLCITLHACVCCCFYTGVVSMLYCGSFQFTCQPITCVCSHIVGDRNQNVGSVDSECSANTVLFMKLMCLCRHK